MVLVGMRGILDKKNKRGQVWAYGLMLGLVVIILGMALATPIKQYVEDVRSPTDDYGVGLDCSNSSISDYQKAQCVLTDITLPYFVFSLLALGGLIVAAKFYFGGGE